MKKWIVHSDDTGVKPLDNYGILKVETVEAAAEEGTVGNIRHLRRQSTSIGETLGLMGYSGSDSDNE